MEQFIEVLWNSVKASMQLAYELWKIVVAWWESLCKKPEVEMEPLEPREKMHELDIAELSKIIYYYKPKET